MINGYAEQAGDTIYIRRTPGLLGLADTGKTGPRGLIDVNGVLYAAYTDSVVKVTGTTVAALTGTLTGTDGVTLARNNRVTSGAATPDVVAVRSTGGAYLLSSTAISAYPDADLPATVNSVDFLDGFFVFTVADGRIFASELNSTATEALSFASAEAKPDGLVRGFVHAGTYYACGTETIEPWKNVGAQPFPLVRHTSVIPVGLLTAMAVAGFETGWDREPFFVAHDGTVRALRGFDATKVSTPDVEAFIAESTVSTLEACVYTAKGNAFWTLSSDQGTWELNVTTGQWHERASTGLNRWRGSRSVKSGGRWIVGDKLSGNLLVVSDTLRTELGQPVTWTIVSAPLKDFPARVAIPGLFGDFTQADGALVNVSWSHDGGKTWATSVPRTLDTADRYPVRVNRIGLSTQHGLRARYSSSSEADFSFLGASVPDPQVRAA
ncbi:hypothetical protein [Microvirga mediterraneensis]|uniref:Uncharacterized protein n=1 Tax=Microvirga mediterraneensis TaxID=2754695 RepID=A0A838BNF0_9HYPH|nr:hypothetical protein [Microvirga mediterraneensis]MBA1156930.1 hypothetical protein [Microvirga mediterraneensis]